MVISVVEQGGDARARVHDLIETSLQTPEEKAKLEVRADEIFATLIDSGRRRSHRGAARTRRPG